MTREARPHYAATGTVPEGGRKMVRISAANLVTKEFLSTCGPLPLVIRPALKHVNLIDWAKCNSALIEHDVLKHKTILFRGFDINTAALVEDFAMATSSGGLLDYRYGSTPRSRIGGGGVYTSTEYPADQTIPFHNEMSYARTWPMKIWFCCLEAAPVGGETPIASSVKVFERLSTDVKARFAEHGVMYVRNYGSGLDLSLQQVFGTSDTAEIEKFCRASHIDYEWRPGGKLRTWQACQAVATHPRTGQTVWFNQAHLYHISSLDQAVSSQLLSEFGEANLPRNAFYGDGTPIEQGTLDVIREAYRQEKVLFQWEQGDILMVDNMLVSHGREPYVGRRRVVVAMAEQWPSSSF